MEEKINVENNDNEKKELLEIHEKSASIADVGQVIVGTDGEALDADQQQKKDILESGESKEVQKALLDSLRRVKEEIMKPTDGGQSFNKENIKETVSKSSKTASKMRGAANKKDRIVEQGDDERIR